MGRAQSSCFGARGRRSSTLKLSSFAANPCGEPRWKKKWMKVANELSALLPQSLRAENWLRWTASHHQHERWRFGTALI
jgi:hypothetical protein